MCLNVTFLITSGHTSHIHIAPIAQFALTSKKALPLNEH